MACENKENTEVSDILLSATRMADSGTKVILSSKVYITYMQFASRISNLQTAQEIPFLLVGNKKKY